MKKIKGQGNRKGKRERKTKITYKTNKTRKSDKGQKNLRKNIMNPENLRPSKKGV